MVGRVARSLWLSSVAAVVAAGGRRSPSRDLGAASPEGMVGAQPGTSIVAVVAEVDTKRRTTGDCDGDLCLVVRDVAGRDRIARRC